MGYEFRRTGGGVTEEGLHILFHKDLRHSYGC